MVHFGGHGGRIGLALGAASALEACTPDVALSGSTTRGTGDDAAESADEETDGGDGGEAGDGGGTCEPWGDPPAALGLGPVRDVRFVDVTAEAGLGHAYFPGAYPPTCDPTAPPPLLAPCKMYIQAGGAAAGDMDGDGDPDLYVGRLGARDLLYENQGDGTFIDVAAASGIEIFDGNAAAWFDKDNDGDLDLFVSGFDLRFRLYENRGGSPPVLVDVADVVALDDGLPHFGFGAGVGDYDGDGWVDLATSEWRGGATVTTTTSHQRVFHNVGGSFEDVTATLELFALADNPAGNWSFSPTFLDLDEDGIGDFAIVSDNGTSRLWYGTSDGRFVDATLAAGVGIERNGMGSTFGDVDGDGHLDWYVSAIARPEDAPCPDPPCVTGGNRLYRSVGPRCFDEQARELGVHAGYWGWGTALFDLDNDGDLDLVETNGFNPPIGPPFSNFVDDPMRAWRNDGPDADGAVQFADVGDATGLSANTDQGRGLLPFDYDGDGDLDLLVLDNGASSRLYANEGAEDNCWLDVRLSGTRSNTEGLGARIEVRRTPGGPVQVREMGVGAHFLAQSPAVAHFGLGPGDAPVAEVLVRWPASGSTSVLTDVAPCSTVVIPEPRGP